MLEKPATTLTMPLPSVPRGYYPSAPKTVEDLNIPETLLADLVLRRLLVEGNSSLGKLSRALRLTWNVVEAAFRHLRGQQLIEVKGMAGNDYNFCLSATGRQLASERFQVSQYAGACPVSLWDYHQATKAQIAKVEIDRTKLKKAYSDLVVSDRMLDQIGPAIIAQSSIFMYGPSGNGKTSLAERMLRVYEDTVLIPYAVEVDSQIVSMFDPVVHHPVEQQDENMDQRWIRCKRPFVVVGGELVPSMLELRLDEGSGVYAAPLQMKANNGILVIDDFGRQLMSPRDLLNRWIVPLDRRVDYLTLRYGVKFQIPFQLMVVFSTNLDPSDLADEAFLRRIQNKIYVDPIDDASFDEVFARVARARKIDAPPGASAYLRQLCMTEGRKELRACYPYDICNLLMAIGRYEGRPPQLTRVDLERAVKLYFAKTSWDGQDLTT